MDKCPEPLELVTFVFEKKQNKALEQHLICCNACWEVNYNLIGIVDPPSALCLLTAWATFFIEAEGRLPPWINEVDAHTASCEVCRTGFGIAKGMLGYN